MYHRSGDSIVPEGCLPRSVEIDVVGNQMRYKSDEVRRSRLAARWCTGALACGPSFLPFGLPVPEATSLINHTVDHIAIRRDSFVEIIYYFRIQSVTCELQTPPCQRSSDRNLQHLTRYINREADSLRPAWPSHLTHNTKMDGGGDPERADALEQYKKKLLETREMEAKLKTLRLDIKSLQTDFDTTEDNIKALQSVGQIIGEVLKQLDEERCKPVFASLDK